MIQPSAQLGGVAVVLGFFETTEIRMINKQTHCGDVFGWVQEVCKIFDYFHFLLIDFSNFC